MTETQEAEILENLESTEKMETPSPSQTQNPAKKVVSQKQYDHLAKAREAKKRKAEDSIENVLKELRNFVNEYRLDKNKNQTVVVEETQKKVDEPPPDKKQKIYDSLIPFDPTFILPALAVLSMVTLGGIGTARHYLTQTNMYDYL